MDSPQAKASDPSAARARRKWVSHGLSNRVVYGGLLRGGTRLPLAVLRAISRVGNAVAVVILRRTVDAMASNYQTALGLAPKEARRLARRTFFAYGETTVDLWRLRSGRDDLIPKLTTAERDGEVLRRLHAGDRGFLLASAHVGNWEMGAAALRTHGIPVSVLGQPELDPRVHEMRLAIRRRLGVESIDIGSSVSTAIRVRAEIERGRAVALAVDRAFAKDSITVPFFGRLTPFLRSPALIARFCGCPLLPCFFLRNPDGSYRGVLGEPVASSPCLSPEEDSKRIMTAVARAVESAVREAPTQWFNFYKYWA